MMSNASQENRPLRQDSALAELVQYNSRAWLKKTIKRRSSDSSREVNSNPRSGSSAVDLPAVDLSAETPTSAGCKGYATTIVPLRERDEQVLSDLFTQDEIEAIEVDIIHNLLRRCPEPCWEEDLLDFLREYL